MNIQSFVTSPNPCVSPTLKIEKDPFASRFPEITFSYFVTYN